MTWTLDDSREIYGIAQRDLKFLDINENGDLFISLLGNTITIKEIISKVTELSRTEKFTIQSFALRIPQLVEYQIQKIMELAKLKIEQYNYNGSFQPMYPIKVNQQKTMVKAVLKSNPNYGLEAGTKSELILILNELRDQKERLIMCNGVKDREYIQIVKQALEENFKIIFSIETVGELKNVLRVIPHRKIQLALRVKPYIKIQGHWESTSERDSKFGLGIAELVEVMEFLDKEDLKKVIVGIHAHPGSQITNLENLIDYNKFLAKIYLQLTKQGFKNLKMINLGGGLPIDYESNMDEQTLETYFEYAIKTIKEILKEGGIAEHPKIMIEAGRAITALSSMIVIKPISINSVFPNKKASRSEELELLFKKIPGIETEEDVRSFLKKWDLLIEGMDKFNISSLYQEEYYTHTMFDNLRLHLMTIPLVLDIREYPRIYKAKQYLLGNFSVFNSVADHVMIKQYFPVLMIDNLHVRPKTISRFVDLTCDSDGEISTYKMRKGENKFTTDGYPLSSSDPMTLSGFPVGHIDLDSSYTVIPLVGGYQDTIEFDYNLIGDLPDVELVWRHDHFEVKIIDKGETIEDIVKPMGYTIKNPANPYFEP